MNTHIMAHGMDVGARGRAADEPEKAAGRLQGAMALGGIAIVILGAAALGRLQATITSRDAEILLLNQTRVALETRLSELDYRLRVLWDDVRVAEEKAQKAAKRS